MIVLIIVAAILVIMGVLILIGKGDNLIAGYNTASEEEKAQYNVKRLRGLIGGLLIVLAPMMLLLNGEDTMAATWSFCALVFVLCIVVVILANTWAKNK
jgi:preprotein translocase subunit SecG